MSESLLESLMQLFALLTDTLSNGKANRARSWAEVFLKQSFSGELINQYLTRYDYYLSQYRSEEEPSDQIQRDKVAASRYMKILAICRHVNGEMEQEPRIILVGLLLTFLQSDEAIGDEEMAFVGVVARELQIFEEDFQNLSVFILKEPLKVVDKSALLIIHGEDVAPVPGIKEIVNSRQQVVVWVLHIRSTNSFFFRYSGARNLYMNGTKMEQNRAHLLMTGSMIKTSLMPPIYYGTIAEKFLQREDRGKILYRAIDISYKFNNNQIGIHPFSFRGRSGQLVAVMGGSGTGKSTLLNVLNGNYKISSGHITINGHNLHTEGDKLQGVIGFVPQDDMLIEEFTVFENLYYNAKLCFSHLTDTDIVTLVEKALTDFDLVEARDLVVGNPLRKVLSGGQRKRLNIALELIREPSILFVDEPTSGLSSMDSEKVVVLLKKQTLKGKLVIINIHQPASDLYKLIDKLLIIDKGGYIIFNGNPMDAIVYFKQQAQYVNAEERECQTCGNVKTEQPMRIIEARMVSPSGKPIRKRKVKPQEWYDLYLEKFEHVFDWKFKNASAKKEKLPTNLYNIPGRVRQFKIFSMRDMLAKIKDKQYLLINFLEAPLLAVILGFFTKYVAGTPTDSSAYVFSENVNLPAYLFMSVVVSLFLGLNVSAEEIIKDRKLLKREKFLNLSRFSYLSSKMLILFAISAIQSLSFVLVGNAILEVHNLSLSYWGILFSTACFANMLGLNISSGFNSVVSIYILIPLILVPQLLFSGVIVSFDKLHKSMASEEYVPRIGDFMISRWAYEALSVNQFMNNNYEERVYPYDRLMSQSTFFAGTFIPALQKVNDECLYFMAKQDTIGLQDNVSILQNEVERIQIEWPQFQHLIKVPSSDFSKASAELLTLQFDTIKTLLNGLYRQQRAYKDKALVQLAEKLGGDDKLIYYKQRYYNEALAAQLLKKNELKQIDFTGTRYLQRRHPVYQKPLSNWGRAHFYSPEKRYAGFTISTPVFNVIVIWLASMLLYVTLYFDWLKKAMYFFEKFRLKRLNKRLQQLAGM